MPFCFEFFWLRPIELVESDDVDKPRLLARARMKALRQKAEFAQKHQLFRRTSASKVRKKTEEWR